MLDALSSADWPLSPTTLRVLGDKPSKLAAESVKSVGINPWVSWPRLLDVVQTRKTHDPATAVNMVSARDDGECLHLLTKSSQDWRTTSQVGPVIDRMLIAIADSVWPVDSSKLLPARQPGFDIYIPPSIDWDCGERSD